MINSISDLKIIHSVLIIINQTIQYVMSRNFEKETKIGMIGHTVPRMRNFPVTQL